MSSVSRRSRAAARRRQTWLPIAVTLGVLVLAVAGIAIYAALQPPRAATPDQTGVVVAKITNLPASVFDTVGTGGVKNPLRPPAVAQTAAPGRPSVLYVGAEYCPYCAAERWSLVIALSRFGTFDGLKLSSSSSTDVYPNTATLSFLGTTYRSSYLDFVGIETADRQGRALMPLPPSAQALMRSQNPSGSIPFVSYSGRWYTTGAAYPPDVLAGKDWRQIADTLPDPGSSLTRPVVGDANYMTAAICRLTGGQPVSVCSSPGVKAADDQIR